ncbi:MAG: LexA family transcriptional regulator [Comamonas sp.]|nr:LexA family transcriptional regulator [Comamonas sp.]
MALGARIRYYREKANFTLEQLSERSGVDVGTISALENRDSSRSKFATAIAQGFGMTLEMLEDESQDLDVVALMSAPRPPSAPTPVGVPLSSRDLPPEGYVRLPVMAEASAGPGRVPLLEAIQPVDVLESYIRQKLNANPRNLKVLTARGSSMTGVIEDGDIMFVEPTTEFNDDGIYILTLDDLVRVKRLSVSMATGNVLIESNDGRKTEELPLKEVPYRLHIQGRVVGSWSLRSFA